MKKHTIVPNIISECESNVVLLHESLDQFSKVMIKVPTVGQHSAQYMVQLLIGTQSSSPHWS